jgi:glycosyltransferase involved in cell wall biosynthesis
LDVIQVDPCAKAQISETATSCDNTTVAIVIPTFNQARFLAEAITSVLAQTQPADELIVVDDGSKDDPAGVVAQFPKIKLIRQRNRGVSAARNVGIQNCTARYIIFLDADDRLLPSAIEAGLACIRARPDCAFVYGGYREISEDGRAISADYLLPLEGDSRLALIRRDLIGPPVTVMFRRDCLVKVGGFDETLRWSEDSDLNLRLAQKYPIANHLEIVAEYRKHDQNKSNDHVEMLKEELAILHRLEAGLALDIAMRAAFRSRRIATKRHRIWAMLTCALDRWRAHHNAGILLRDFVRAARWAPILTTSMTSCALGRQLTRKLVDSRF